MNRWTRKIEDVAEAVRAADGECVVLIGAGCSKSAGIPLAGELIREVAKTFPAAYGRASDPNNYNKVMAELSTMQRRVLLNRHIDAARINWAHLALAQLFLNNKIERILTVNFDPLVVRACALVGLFPAIYDLATAESFRKAHIAPRSVFYLNGQHTGFVTLNAEDELERHRKRLKSIVEETGTRRTWIVVGYSGGADPLLDTLAENEFFEGGLYWIGYDADPTPAVREKLLDAGKDAFYVGGQDADGFLTGLAQRLECFPPSLIVRPFSHISTIVNLIDFSTGGDSGAQQELDLRRQIAHAESLVVCLESRANARSWLLAGKFELILDWFNRIRAPDEEDLALGAWARIGQGNEVGMRANALSATDPLEARRLFAEAGQYFSNALTIKTDMYEAANNWGIALYREATVLVDTDLLDARRLWKEAGLRYARALEIKADSETASSWGNALAAEAKALAVADLPEACRLWGEARERYSLALTIDATNEKALNNWSAAFIFEFHALRPVDIKKAYLCLDEAEVILKRAESIRAGCASYHLACVAALRRDVARAVDELLKSSSMGYLPTASHIRADQDFDGIRSSLIFGECWVGLFGPDEPLV